MRLTELVYAFGNSGTVASICRDEWAAAFDVVTLRLRDFVENP